MLVNRLNNTLPCQPLVSGGGAPVFEFGNALKFDGADDYVGPNTDISNLNDVSLSCWIKNEESPAYIMLLGVVGLNYFFAARMHLGVFKFTGSGIFKSHTTTIPATTEEWFHIGVIQSGNNISYYHNGVLLTTLTSPLKRSDIDLIGRFNVGLPYKGLLDEYVWWDSALTDAQMKNQYNLGAGNFADADVTPLVYYSCNQVDGTTPLVNDGSGGSSYNGTLNNFATPYFVPHTPAVDADAAAFISAAAITGATQKSALNQLVLDLKGTGSTTNNSDLWTSKLHAFYPTSPIDDTTASLTACSYNLRDVSLYQITWYNSPTVSIQGVTGNGSSMYGDTGYNPSTEATLNSSHFSIYKDVGWDLTTNFWGCRVGGSSVFEHTYDAGEAWSAFYATSTSGRLKQTMGNTNVDKFRIICNRASSSLNSVYENGASIGSISTTDGSLPNADVFLLYSNGLNWDESTMQCSSLGLGLTVNESKDLDDAIQTYNTALGR